MNKIQYFSQKYGFFILFILILIIFIIIFIGIDKIQKYGEDIEKLQAQLTNQETITPEIEPSETIIPDPTLPTPVNVERSSIDYIRGKPTENPAGTNQEEMGILFLVDMSDNANKCDNGVDLRYKLPAFVGTLADQINKNNGNDRNKIYVSMIGGNLNYNRIIPKDPMNDPNIVEKDWFNQIKDEDKSTYALFFPQAIEEAKDELVNLAADQKILVLITDGLITDDYKGEKIESALDDIRDTSYFDSNGNKRKIDLHIVLVCEIKNEYLIYWKGNDDNENNVVTSDEISDPNWPRQFVNEIFLDKFPKNVMSGWSDKNLASITIPSFHRQAWIDVVSWSPDADLHLTSDMLGEHNLTTEPNPMHLSWNTNSVQLVPPMNCEDHQWILQWNNKEDSINGLFYYLVHSKKPEFTSTITINDEELSENNTNEPSYSISLNGDDDLSANIKVAVTSKELSATDFQNYMHCYKPWIGSNDLSGQIFDNSDLDLQDGSYDYDLGFPLKDSGEIRIQTGIEWVNSEPYDIFHDFLIKADYIPVVNNGKINYIEIPCDPGGEKCDALQIELNIDYRGLLEEPSLDFRSTEEIENCGVGSYKIQDKFELITSQENNSFLFNIYEKTQDRNDGVSIKERLLCGDLKIILSGVVFTCKLSSEFLSQNLGASQVLECSQK